MGSGAIAGEYGGIVREDKECPVRRTGLVQDRTVPEYLIIRSCFSKRFIILFYTPEDLPTFLTTMVRYQES